jgi:hypothetical protein
MLTPQDVEVLQSDRAFHRRVVIFILDDHRAGAAARFLFRPATPHVRGICFSCGKAVPVFITMRCWRCAMAWRLAVDRPVPEALAEVRDTCRVAS